MLQRMLVLLRPILLKLVGVQELPASQPCLLGPCRKSKEHPATELRR